MSKEKITSTITENGITYTKETFTSGNIYWEVGNKLHRVDAPAVEHIINEKKEWWLNGKLVFNDSINNMYKFELTDKMKKSILKYKLSKE